MRVIFRVMRVSLTIFIQISNPMSSLSYLPQNAPLFAIQDGGTISTTKSKILAVGVALFFSYLINFFFMGLLTFKSVEKEEDRGKMQRKLLQVSRVLFLFALACTFSVYAPFYASTVSAVFAWFTLVIVILMHVFCILQTKVRERSLWSWFYMLYHLFIGLWLIFFIPFVYSWTGNAWVP